MNGFEKEKRKKLEIPFGSAFEYDHDDTPIAYRYIYTSKS